MLLKIFRFPIFFILFYAVIAVERFNKEEEIYDISSKIVIYDKKVLQLEVTWNDTLPKDTMYNVIVNPVNLTECPELPCSLYGVQKPTNTLVMPENPTVYLETMECSYMPGCNYTLTVETSNAVISKTLQLSLPQCIEHICSCQHATALPSVNITSFRVVTNHTIDTEWAIIFNNSQYFYDDLNLTSIHLMISKQSNPTLSWGGQHSPIAERIYPLGNSYQYLNGSWLRGNVSFELEEPLPEKTVLLLRTYIMDSRHCMGAEKIFKTKVSCISPATLVERNLNMRLKWVIISIPFVLVFSAILASCLWRQQRIKRAVENLRRDQKFPALAPVMEEIDDHIFYSDKSEDAQLQELADTFEIPHHAIRLGPEIGEGAFGRVFKATALDISRKCCAREVAVKQLKTNPTADEIKEFLTEIEMLKGVGSHPNIVSFLGCCTIRPPYLMVMEFVGRGDLLSYLHMVRQELSRCRIPNVTYVNTMMQPAAPLAPISYMEMNISEDSVYDDAEEMRQPKTSFAETSYTIIDGVDEMETCEPFQYILHHKELHSFALQIANGMRFLEDLKVVHRDLAARNVLIDDRKVLKISDFGLSRFGIYTNTKTRKLPLRWLAIESIRDSLYSNKSDVWAYGIVLWEIGTLGASPYPTISNSELIPFLLSGQRLAKPEICTDEVYTIMQQCWHEDPHQRPSFENLYQTLSQRVTYVDISSLSDDYVFPQI